jgi:hypothetical protein
MLGQTEEQHHEIHEIVFKVAFPEADVPAAIADQKWTSREKGFLPGLLSRQLILSNTCDKSTLWT